jgi:Flp pilus assembly protein TadG
MRTRRRQRGQAIVLVAVMLGVVVGMAALAIDGSRAYATRRDLQAAVDAASLAAADNLQRSGSYVSAEQAATTSFGTNLRLYTAPSCTPGYGSPGAASYTVTCTYSDGTALVQTVQAQGPRGSLFQLTATRTLQLQFGRILTNGATPAVSTAASGRVNNLLYSPAVAALAQNGCGGAAGSAISVSGFGTLSVLGDVVASGRVSVTLGGVSVGGDIYARCQSSISGAWNACYPSGASMPCTYPDVAGAVRSGYHFVDPRYPAPAVTGGSQPTPTSTVNLVAGLYLAVPTFNSDRCWFLGGGVYDWAAGYSNTGDLVSNELKPPDEPTPANNTLLASPQFWNTSGSHCAGSVQAIAIQCTGTGNCGGGNCGQGVGQGAGCTSAPPGDWAIEVTSTRTDTYNGTSYFRESAPSMCQVVHVGNNQGIQLTVSNVPGATAYYIYAALPGVGCGGPFGYAELLPVSVPVLNNSLAGCPAFTGTSCSLGFESIILNGNDIGSPFAPNAGASPGTVGAYPPSSETAPLLASHPNQNPARGAGSAGDRANENNCETAGGAYATCPAAITAGAVEFYLPGACLSQGSGGDTYVFSGYQYDWLAVYEPPAVGCTNTVNANFNSAYVGLVYTPGAALTVSSQYAFAVAATGGLIANTVTFNGSLPSIVYGAGYAPVPFAARLVS